MPRTLKVAAVQMIAAPASTAERLERAESLVAQAAAQGARLVVLPELFNTGYEYSPVNYERAERFDGRTVTWMRQAAAHYGVHLAGTLLLLEPPEIYNALFLFAPEGRCWRYDKTYPWQWERAYFRGGHGIRVADTTLGKFGLLICWDAAHPRLWAQYAGQVDAMLVASCPPAMHALTWVLPDGARLPAEQAGPAFRRIRATAGELYGRDLRAQSAHLGVPVIHTTGTGRFASPVPLPRVSLAVYALFRPDWWGHVLRARDVRLETGYFNETYIANGDGQVLERVPPDSEGYAIAEITLPSQPPQPQGPRPALRIGTAPYLFDAIANALLAPVYRRNMQRLYGSRTE
jgi:predicted amidohydrolase